MSEKIVIMKEDLEKEPGKTSSMNIYPIAKEYPKIEYGCGSICSEKKQEFSSRDIIQNIIAGLIIGVLIIFITWIMATQIFWNDFSQVTTDFSEYSLPAEHANIYVPEPVIEPTSKDGHRLFER